MPNGKRRKIVPGGSITSTWLTVNASICSGSLIKVRCEMVEMQKVSGMLACMDSWDDILAMMGPFGTV